MITFVTCISICWKFWKVSSSRKDTWTGSEMNWLAKLLLGGIADFAKDWHDYEVHDLDRIRSIKSNCLLVGYHSRSTLDLFYLTCTIQCHALATHLLFYIPIIGHILPLLGVIPSKGGVQAHAEEAFIETLSNGDRPLMLLPGGAVECMKAYHNRYRVLWKEVPGFSRVIRSHPKLQENTRIVPFYTKNCELSLWSTAWWYTQSGRGVEWLMNAFKAGDIFLLPVMMILLLCSLGFFPLPAPCKMDTYFGEPLIIKKDETSAEFANRVKTALHELVDKVNGLPPRPRRKTSMIYMVFLGLFTFFQNIFVHSVGISLLIVVLWPVLIAVYFIQRVARIVKRANKDRSPTKKEN